MKKITYEDMHAAFEKAIADRGADYVYEPAVCTYFDAHGAPSCGVGYALVELGLGEELKHVVWDYQEIAYPGLLEKEGALATLANAGQPLSYGALSKLEEWGAVEIEPAARHLANSFQSFQDGRAPWGESLTNAEMSAAIYSGRLQGAGS